VIGDFENDMDGWALWADAPAGTTTSYSTTGASLNDYSLKVDVPTAGWKSVVYIPLHTEGLIGNFLSNNTFSMDVTYDPNDWSGLGGWVNFELVINSGDGGWDQLGRPDTDTVNSGYTAGWDPTNFPTVQTRTVTWDYSDVISDITADTSYLELIFVTNYDADFTSGAYYLDNVRLTSPGAAGEPNLVGWWKFDEGSGTVAIDFSGNGLDGTINGNPAWGTSSPSDQSPYLLFDGTNDWVDVNSIPQGKFLFSNYTIAMWFRVDGGSGQRDLFGVTNSIGDHGILLEHGHSMAPDGIRYINRAPFSPAGMGAPEEIYTPSNVKVNDDNWHHVAAVRESDTSRLLYVDGVLVGSNTNNLPAFTEPARVALGVCKYSWLARWWNGAIDDVRIYDVPLSLAEIQMLIFSPLASMPSPLSGAKVAQRDPVLSWKPGGFADTHDVYFGTDVDDVNDANTTNLDSYPNVTYANVDVNSFIPGNLELDTTYYWRVDEVSGPNIRKGVVWNFTIENYLVLDDMESYNGLLPDNPDSKRIWRVWKDGIGFGSEDYPPTYCGNGTGSAVGDLGTVSLTEETIIHGGSQSMPYYYANDGSGINNCDRTINLYYSEAERAFDSAQDWSAGGIKALSLWFYGDLNNDANASSQMYVKVNGAKVLYDGSMNDIKEPSWHEWMIDLTDFNVDLTNVTKLSIGFGDESNMTPAGSGKVIFDDIRLYQPRCILSKRSTQFARIDFAPAGDPSGDCVIDYREIEIMARDWLVEDDVIEPTTNPALAGGLVAHYPLDEGTGTTAADASGKGHDGIFSPTAANEGGITWITPGLMGTSAIDVNGASGSLIDIGTWDPAAGTGQLTLSLWVRWSGLRIGLDQGLIGKRDDWATDGLRFMFVIDTPGNNSGIALRQFSAADTDVNSVNGIMLPYIGRWAHVAATFDGTTARIYLNGGEIASGPFTLGAKTDASMAIGNTNGIAGWGGGRCPEVYNGDMDEVRIYNRALSPAEIAYLADTTPGDGQLHIPVPSPAELYEFEELGSRAVNFRDFAFLADVWLDEMLWP